MGLFGKLFDKKACDLCGGEIGLLGNRKLEDGNCCKECAAKLSPWFSERRSSTVESIREQLEYREANKAAVAAFHTTTTLGQNTKVLLDEDAGVYMITSARNLQEANPDVLKLSDITGCTLDVEEHSSEVRREVKDKEGHVTQESYNPKRYTYSYDFYIELNVNNPYFSQIRFKLNNSDVDVECGGGGISRPAPGHRPAPGAGMLPGSTTPPTMAMRKNNAEYAKYEAMGEEIKAALLQVRQAARASAAAAAAPKMATKCPHCDATTTADANGCCEYCGGALNG